MHAEISQNNSRIYDILSCHTGN